MPAHVEIWGDFAQHLLSRMEDTAEKCRRAMKRKQWIDKWAPHLPDGVKIHMGVYDLFWSLTIDFSRESLPEMRRLLGRCTVTGKDICDARKNTIYVSVAFEGMGEDKDLISFRYVRQLAEESKCRIVEQVEPREERVTHSLVCSRL